MNLLAGLAVVAGAAEVNLREFSKVTKGNQLEFKCLASAQAYSDVERCVNYRTQLRGSRFMHTCKCPHCFLIVLQHSGTNHCTHIQTGKCVGCYSESVEVTEISGSPLLPTAWAVINGNPDFTAAAQVLKMLGADSVFSGNFTGTLLLPTNEVRSCCCCAQTLSVKLLALSCITLENTVHFAQNCVHVAQRSHSLFSLLTSFRLSVRTALS